MSSKPMRLVFSDGILISLILCGSFAGPALASIGSGNQILYVAQGAPPNGDGLSWATAMSDLQSALSFAAGGEVREIRVAKGTYLPDRGTGDRNATFQLINNVEIKGGYAGPSASDPNVRDPRALKTILTGAIGASGNTDNSIHVVTGTGTNRTAILDGFTITQGFALSQGTWFAELENGAGVYINPGSPTIRNCVITQNRTGDIVNLFWAGSGAGVFSQGQALIQNCLIEDNFLGGSGEGNFGGDVGANGGGLWLAGGNIVEGCIIRNNRAGSGGSGFCMTGACNPPGRGGHGGGVYATSAEVLRNCLIEDNRSGVGGSGGGCNPDPNPCYTCPNVTASWGRGGGVYGNPVIENCTIVNNLAADQPGGVGVYGAARISNSIIWGNGTNPVSQVTSDAIIDHSAIQGWSGGPVNGNISLDPLFVTGPLSDFYLSQTASGQPATSPCVDTGNNTAATLGLDQRITRTDGVADSSVVDMGFHYPVQCAVDSDCMPDEDFCNGTEYCEGRACISSGNPCGSDDCCDAFLSSCIAASTDESVLFVAQREGDRVSRFHGQTGDVLSTPVPPGHGGVDYANGIALSKYDGSLWVASAITGRIEKFKPGNVACAYDHIGSINYYYPISISGLVYGPDGYFYFSDYNQDRLGQVFRNGGFGFLNGCGLDGPTGSAFLNSNTILVGSEKNDKVIAFNIITRTCSLFAEGCGLDAPVGIAVAPDGSVLVASYANDSVFKFDPTGNCLGTFVNTGSCGLDGPQGIAFGPNGNLFVSSLNTDQVLEYSGASGLPIDRDLSQPGVQCQFTQPGQLDGPTFLLWMTDCNHNGIDDEVDVQQGQATDCDENRILDSCELDQNLGLDADSNGVLDICQVDPDQTIRFVDVAVCPRAGTGRDQDPFCSIQRAIDMAVDGHEVVVRPGSYYESINFKGKAIVVRSAEGPAQTTIKQCTLNSSETRASVLSGLTITGSYNSSSSISLTNTSPTISGCIIKNNSGGIYSVGGAPLIRDCIITKNGSDSWYRDYFDGGGIYVDGPAEIERCTIINNAAIDGTYGGVEYFGGPGGHGGGAYLTGGATIRNSLIAFNKAGDGVRDICSGQRYPSGSGGGIYAGSNVKIIGCTIVWNAFGGATGTEGQGNGIYSATNTNRVENCVVYANWHQYGRFATQDDVAGVFEAIEHSCITRPLVPGIGNIALPHVDSEPWPESLAVPAPYFEDFYGPDQVERTSDDNFRLKAGSPCADAGSPDFVPLPGEVDLDGQSRVQCGRVDIGAYETGNDSSGCTTLYDLKGVAVLMGCARDVPISTIHLCSTFDFNADSRVNLLDVAAFIEIADWE